jgi:acetyl-CoA acetyltransferase
MARDLRQKPAYVMAASQGMGPRNFTMNNFFKDPFLESPGAYAAKALWEMAGVTPQDVDVAQLYDAFSPLVLGSLEEYGFCRPGEAGAFVENHGLELGGHLPCNTSGGSLSEAYVHGINMIIEATRQIRGTSCNQVPGARLSLCTSGNMVPTGAILLRGD